MARQIFGEAYVQILPIDGGVNAGTQKIIDNLPKSVNVPVNADTAQAEQAVATLRGSIEEGIGGAWAAAGVQAALFTGAVLGIKRAIDGAVQSLAGLFDQLAQAQAGFTAILGSESAGTRLLDDIREFARVSPFVTQELVNYSQQLLGVGQSAESIVPLLKNTGDLIASVGGDTQNISRVLFTLTQIRSIGRLVGQDAIQLQSALIPITKLLADFLGKTTAEVKKLQEQGAISADTVFAAISAAGQKVEGAMNNATRNIAGAQSVLRDTVTIMAQDSEFLNKVFDDLVQGILGFSQALGENEELTQNIDAIDRGLTSLYENIQPLIEAFGETGAAVALDGLSILASTLEILAGALDAIPDGALELIGRGLAIIFALKAPLALISYAQNIERLTSGLKADLASRLGNTAAGINQVGDASQQSAAKVGQLTAAQKGLTTALTAATFAAGLFVNSIAGENDALNTLGTALSTGALGAQLGAAFGPGGIAIGAAAGAGIGIVTSFLGNAREEAERRQKEFEEVGQKMADDVLKSFSLTTPTITSGDDFESFFTQLGPIEEQLTSAERAIRELTEARDRLIQNNQNAAGGVLLAEPEEYLTDLENLSNQIEEVETKAGNAREALKSLLTEGAGAEALAKLTTILSTLNKESEAYTTIVEKFAVSQIPLAEGASTAEFLANGFQRAQLEAVLLGQAAIDTEEELAALEGVAQTVGLSVEQFMILPFEDLVLILDGKLPSAITQARIEMSTLSTAFTEAKKATDEFFKPFLDNLNSAQASLQAQQGLNKAADTFIGQQTESNALAYADALLKLSGQIAAANEAAFKDTGQAAGVSALVAQLDLLREELELTTPEFEALLEQMGLLSLYRTGTDAGFTGGVKDLGEEVGITEAKLRQLIPSLNRLRDGQEFTIPFTVVDKLRELERFTQGLSGIPIVGQEIVEQLEAHFTQLDFQGGLITPIEGAIDGMNRLRLAAAGTFLDMISLIDQVKAAGLDTFALEAEQTFLDIEARRQNEARTSPDFNEALQRQRELAAIDQLARQRAAEEIARKAAEEADRLRKEQERLAEAARREAERIAREAEAAAREQQRLLEEQMREQERLADALKNAGETIQSAMLNASEAIANAAKEWTASIRERVQDERPVSISRLIGNTQDQVGRLSELNTGIQTLEGRGLSREALAAIGIDNVTDIRQLRRLLAADPTQLATLTQLISQRDSNAELIARRERQAETQATIVAAIIQAAQILGTDLTPAQAAQLALNVNVTGDPASAVLPSGIIDQLVNAGLILRT